MGSHELVLPRGMCRFGRFELGRVPASKRHAALSLMLPGWAPFRDIDHLAVWADGTATVWCWDKAQLQARLRQHGYSGPAFATTVPETLLRPPEAEGLRLVRTLDGVEAQQWLDGSLLASRWWPQAPDAAAWTMFQRDCGVALESQQPLPTIHDLAWLPRPWARATNAGRVGGGLERWEQGVHGALLLAGSVAVTLLGVREVQLQRGISQRQAQLESVKQSAAPLLQARELARSRLEQIRQIDGLQRFPEPLALMAAIAQRLPDKAMSLREWELADGKLKLLFTTTQANILGADVAAALEKTLLFSNIKLITQVDPRQIGFSMDLRSMSEVESAAGSAKP